VARLSHGKQAGQQSGAVTAETDLHRATGNQTVLTKELLRVTRRGGGYQPLFVDAAAEPLAARVIGIYQGHVGKSRETLQEALGTLERESEDFKLVRGFAKLVERKTSWRVDAPMDPTRIRRRVFEEAESVGVVSMAEREQVLDNAANSLGLETDVLEHALYADLERNAVLEAIDRQWSPETLRLQYNLSLAQTALFDATEVRIRTSDPKAVVSQLKRLGLLYEIRKLPNDRRRTVAKTDREILVTGPDALFSQSRRYGTRFAQLLRTIANTQEWELRASINDRGTERELVLTDEDVTVPEADPVTVVDFDSEVEASFARRFEALDTDWTLVREPDAIAAGEHVVIPDFAFDWNHTDFRLYFEIMGFWTPEYVEKKLARFDAVADVELLVAVDETLGVGEEIEARGHQAISYRGDVDLGAVRTALRSYETQLVADAATSLPEELVPDAAVTTVEAVAEKQGVSVDALSNVTFPEHERVGRTLIRPTVLAALSETLEAGMELATVEERLSTAGIDEQSAVLAALGYRIEWAGLGGGTLRKTEE